MDLVLKEEQECHEEISGVWTLPDPWTGATRFSMEGKCEKKMWVDFRVLENPSPRRNGFSLESPLTFIFIL